MQKGDSAKLKLLLAGISARLTKNRDFFVQADCTLVSGKKKFDAKLSRADEDYTLHFQGSDRRVDAAEFCAFFAEQAEKYDESVLTYTERSTVVTLSVTARGVRYCIAAAVSSAWTSRSTLLTRAVRWRSVSAITI